MKFYLLIISFVYYSTTVSSQGISLKILGHSNYIEYAKSNGLKISIKKNDKAIIKQLSDSIYKLGIKSKIVNTPNYLNTKELHYLIEEQNVNHFNEIVLASQKLKIKIVKIYFKMPEHIFKEEDKKAILALKDANFKAKIIANHLGYKNIGIISIDDETCPTSSLFDDMDIDGEKLETILNLLSLLDMDNSLYQTENSKPIRNGGYNLWVKYLLK